jgi:hypothetical protein
MKSRKYILSILSFGLSVNTIAQNKDSLFYSYIELQDDSCSYYRNIRYNRKAVYGEMEYYRNGQLKSMSYYNVDSFGILRKRNKNIFLFSDDRCFNCSYSISFHNRPGMYGVYADLKYEWYPNGSVKRSFRLNSDHDTTKIQEINLTRVGDTLSIRSFSMVDPCKVDKNKYCTVEWYLDGESYFWELEDKLIKVKTYNLGKLTLEAVYNMDKLKIGEISYPDDQNDSSNQYIGYLPDNGFVPDAATAIKIAEAVWIPIYGQKQIEEERPFKAKLVQNGSVWLVYGTLPEGWVGGTAVVRIRKSDGKIIYLTHEK